MTDAQMAVNLVAFGPDQKACTASEVVCEGRKTGFRNRRVPHFEICTSVTLILLMDT